MEEEKDEDQYSCPDGDIAVEHVRISMVVLSAWTCLFGNAVTYIQKHQRQVTYCVNAPPITGPMQTLIANVLVTMVMHNGRFLSLIVLVIITRDP